MLASCSERQEATQSEADSTGIDTTILRVAVMPTMSCLPVYYAERSGLAARSFSVGALLPSPSQIRAPLRVVFWRVMPE